MEKVHTDPALAWLIERPLAHRGLHDPQKRIYENTLSACEAAVAANYGIELDVQLSADGEAMVFHDEDLRRMCGLPEKVAAMDCAELSRMPILDSDDTVRSLPKILSAVNGAVPVVIELKGNPPHDEGLVEAVLTAVRSYSGPVAVMSFSLEIVRMLSEGDCPCPIGLTATGSENSEPAHDEAIAYGISFVSYDVAELPNAFVDRIRSARKMPVITWTVRTPEQAAVTYEHADQITFEGFDPDAISNA